MFSWAEHVFACLLSKTKLIFLPHGGNIFFMALKPFPSLCPSILSLPVSCSPKHSGGTSPRGFFPLSRLFSAQISAVSTSPLSQLGSCDSPSQSSSCSCGLFPSTGVSIQSFGVAGGSTGNAAAPKAHPRAQGMSSASSTVLLPGSGNLTVSSRPGRL